MALVEAADAQIADGNSLAGDALNTVRLDGVRPIAVASAPPSLDPHAHC